MIGNRPGIAAFPLILVPAATLAAGVALATATARESIRFEAMYWVALLGAALGPVIAAAALRWLAPGFDLVLVATAAMMTAVGSTALALLATVPGADGEFYRAIVARHGLFVAAGFLALVVGAVSAIHIDLNARYPYTLLGVAFLLIAVTVIAGEEVNGARLWLRLGPVRFQPSEVARLLLAAFVASYLHDRRHLVASSWKVRAIDLPPAPYLLPVGGAVLGAVAVLILQNDLGMAALVVLGAIAALVGVQSSRTFVSVALVVLGLAVAGSYGTVARVRERVSGWLNPWQDPAGMGFQFIQADFGLAAGGLTGYGAAPTPANIPEVHTDLILAAIAGRMGVVGAVAVLALAGVLVCRCVSVALKARDGFRALLALSIASLIGIQVLLIVGGTLRVLPLTGLTFPLVSYGGTSIVATLFALGVVTGIGKAPR